MKEDNSSSEGITQKQDGISKKSPIGDTNTDSPDEIAEALNEMPPQLRRSFTMAMMQTSRGNTINPLIEKLTDEHINKFLDYSQKDDEYKFKFKSTNRWFYLLYTLLGLCLFIFLIIYLLPNNNDMLKDIFTLFITFLGGLGSGYGLKSRKK